MRLNTIFVLLFSLVALSYRLALASDSRTASDVQGSINSGPSAPEDPPQDEEDDYEEDEPVEQQGWDNGAY